MRIKYTKFIRLFVFVQKVVCLKVVANPLLIFQIKSSYTPNENLERKYMRYFTSLKAAVDENHQPPC